MTPALLLIPIVLQGVVMVVDEGWFHRRRGLPRWERIGHPLDTLTIAACIGWLLIASPGDANALAIYIALAAGSTLFVTKDEPIHARLCSAGEHWLHAVLFVLHPIVLAAFGLLWWTGHHTILLGQLAVTLAFLGYQIVYWTLRGDRAQARPRAIDNAWYADLGARWYAAEDTPIALLRAEARHRNPWIAEEIERVFLGRRCRILDLGCGAGFLSNHLARQGHVVTGLDASDESLAVARHHDGTGGVEYVTGDARVLPFEDASFDVVCAMDLLEHVETPEQVIAEVSRVLAPSGLFFFHTFNRTWQANLVVIKGVEWFVKNTPRDLHVIELFITPEELAEMLQGHGLIPTLLRGSRPRFRWPLWRMLLTGKVGADFAFTFTRSTRLGYTGHARKATSLPAARTPAPAGAARAIARAHANVHRDPG